MSMVRLAKHPRVEHCDDERNCGNGIIITLRKGWTWDAMQDNRVRGFDTVAEALGAVRSEPTAFAGPYDP